MIAGSARRRVFFAILSVGAIASCFGVLFFYGLHEPPTSRREYGGLLSQLVDCTPHVEYQGTLPTEIHFVNPWGNFHLDDRDLEVVSQIPSLKVLAIEFAPHISDAGLAQIAKLPELSHVVIKFTPIGDQAAASLATLPELRSLTLYDTRITDQALNAIAQMPSLETLNVMRSNVSDSGLRKLKDSAALRELIISVDGTMVTKRGLDFLRQVRPGLQIYQDSYMAPVAVQFEPPIILGNSPPTEDPTLLLLAEAVENKTVAQLVCDLSSEQAEKIDLKSVELELRGLAVFEAIKDRLPKAAVDWFVTRIESKQTGEPLTPRELDFFVGEGLAVELRVGCRQGDSRSKMITVR